MKKYLFILLSILVLKINATHNRAGEIIYKRIAPFTSYTFSFTVIKYFDHGSSIADRCVDTLYCGDGNVIVLPRVNNSALTQPCSCGSGGCGELIINEPTYKVKMNIYTGVYTYSAVGTYTARSIDPNRNGSVINMTNSINQRFYIESLVLVSSTITKNSSPILSNYPVDKAIINTCYYHNPGAYDPDGDSLSYEITTCKGYNGQTATGYYFPTGSFNIHPTNGTVTWCNPTMQGEYNIAFLIKEWRKTSCSGAYTLIGYVERDMQILVTTTPPVTLSILSHIDTCIVAGINYSTPFYYSSTNSATLSIIGSAANSIYLPNATLSSTIIGSSANVGFFWNTTCLHARKQAHQLIIVANPSNSLEQRAYKVLNLTIVPSSPTITGVTSTTNNVTLNWTKLNNCNPNLKGYNIYRKIGANSWNHSYCEQGVPAYTGFTLIGFKPATDSSFNDVYFSGVTNGSIGNYIVTSVLNDCAESYADTIKTVAITVGLKQNSLSELNVIISPNPFSDKLTIFTDANNLKSFDATIYDVNGRVVFINKEINVNTKSILNLSYLGSGVYIIELKTKDSISYKKIIKE